jgi:hypothetical protein
MAGCRRMCAGRACRAGSAELHVGAGVHWIFLAVAVGMASFGCLALPGLIRQSGFGLNETATKCPAK